MSELLTAVGVRPVPLDRRLPLPLSPAPRRLPPAAAFYLQASIAVFFLAGSSAPTPLYALYQAEWGFSPITTTIVFGVYALAVLSALLTAGSLSDHVGRRPVLLAAVVAQAATKAVFATASGVPELVVARIVQGLSTGAAMSAIGAGLLDLHKSKGTIANAVAPLTGTALGAIGSGLLVQYLPVPARLVYLLLFRGKQKEQKKHKAMIAELKKGDRVMTIGGLIARVVAVDGEDVTLKIDESANVKAVYRKSSIQQVLGGEEKSK